MKKLIFLFAACCLIFSACKTNNEPEPNKSFRLDPNAKVYIKPVPSTAASTFRAAANTEHLTPLEIVKQGNNLRGYNDSISMTDISWGFAGKDTISETPAFLRYGTDIIPVDGLGKPYISFEFLYAYDCVIEIIENNIIVDTIAYIPNANMRAMESGIKAALAAQDTLAVYDIFNNGLKFTPVTASEYRALKAENLQ